MKAATVAQLGEGSLRRQLAGEGLRIVVGPYTYAIASPVPVVAEGLARLYGDYPLAPSGGFADFHVTLRPAGLAQRLRRQLDFFVDDLCPFASIAASQAYAFFEWGLNWCVSVTLHDYLRLHAAVVAKDGRALVLPGLPGAGKSTLCAALGLRGWRVLSDEHALVPPGTRRVVPICRPVSLKNESIEVIRAFEPSAVLGPVSEATHKGRVAHLKSDLQPDSLDPEPLRAAFMVFPSYRRGAAARLAPRSRAESFLFAAHHSFNFSVLGEPGFRAMAEYIDGVECYDLEYGELDEAIALLDTLLRGGFGA